MKSWNCVWKLFLLIAICLLPLSDSASAKNTCASNSKLSLHGECSVSNASSHLKTTVNLSKLMKLKGGFSLSKAPLPAVKLALQMILSAFNILCWAIPLRYKSFSSNATFLSRANVFAGGIFLMLGFGHLLPHALEGATQHNVDPTLVLKLALGGVLLMFFLEKIAFESHAILHGSNEKDSHHTHHTVGGHDHKATATAGTASAVKTGGNNHHHTHTHTQYNPIATPRPSEKGTLSNRSAILLLFAMSLHSLFETMALGLAADASSSVYMATSIALHQPAESLALLVAFLKTDMSVSSVVKWMLLFSFMGPIGVSAGVFIQKMASPLVEALIVAITAGTFIYLGATEVLNEEFEDIEPSEKWKRFFILLAGISTISIIDYIGTALHLHDH